MKSDSQGRGKAYFYLQHKLNILENSWRAKFLALRNLQHLVALPVPRGKKVEWGKWLRLWDQPGFDSQVFIF